MEVQLQSTSLWPFQAHVPHESLTQRVRNGLENTWKIVNWVWILKKINLWIKKFNRSPCIRYQKDVVSL